MKQFGIKDQIGYMFGDLAGSMISLYIGAFILMFATYGLGIDAKWMAGLFLFAKVWDAINDPLIGSLPDRFKIGKSGERFKPFIRIAMIPLSLSALMIYMDTSSWSSIFKHVWIAVWYIIYGMSYTGASMPYGAMASIITKDPVERTKLSRARSLGGTLVGLLFMPIVPMFIWNNDQTLNRGAFFKLAIVAAAFSICFYTILLKCTTERYGKSMEPVSAASKENRSHNYRFFDVITSALKNRPLLGLMFAALGSSIAAGASVTLTSYVFKEYYNQPKIMSLTSILNVPVMLICFALIPKLAAKFGKKRVIITGCIFNAVIYLFLFLVPLANPYLYLVISTIGFIGQTICMMLTWAMVNESIDWQEYKTGVRGDGTLYSLYTFSKKVGDSISSSGITYLLALIGFVSGIQTQAPGVGENIRRLATMLPIIACAIEIIGFGVIYNLNQKRIEEMYHTLAKKKQQQ